MSAPSAAPQNAPRLTARQREIYDFIAQRIAVCGYAPTIREIGAHLGIRSTNGVADHLKALKRKGYLSQAASKSRTWRPLRRPAEASNVESGTQPSMESALHAAESTIAVPILGKVAAGMPILAQEADRGVLQVDPALLPRGAQVFALEVTGNSMIEAGIFGGDIIFVHKRSDAAPGSIVVVLIDDEATVKRYYRDGERILLQPANAAMQTLVIHADEGRHVNILGVVVGVYRRF